MRMRMLQLPIMVVFLLIGCERSSPPTTPVASAPRLGHPLYGLTSVAVEMTFDTDVDEAAKSRLSSQIRNNVELLLRQYKIGVVPRSPGVPIFGLRIGLHKIPHVSGTFAYAGSLGLSEDVAILRNQRQIRVSTWSHDVDGGTCTEVEIGQSLETLFKPSMTAFLNDFLADNQPVP
jgi:hypothetical protein